MDLPTLIRSNVDRIVVLKKDFETNHDIQARRNMFDEYMVCLTNLHKIYKSNQITGASAEKLKTMIASAAKDAEGMKAEITSPSNNNVKNSTITPNQKHDPAKQTKAPEEKDKDKQGFEDALKGAIITEKPNVKWEDVAGLEVAKQTLKEAIIFPTRFPEIFVGLRRPWKGILLYGVN